MAENKTAETKAEPKAVKPKADSADRETAQERTKREKKAGTWTLDRCMQKAKRFSTRDEWQVGASSSFKAAVAHGWDAQCSVHMKASPIKSTSKKAPVKVAAAKKTPARLPKSA